MTEEDRNGSRHAEELAACFTVHARDLFGYACELSGGNRGLAGDLVQAAFQAAATVWCTLGDLPANQCHDWLRDTLASAAQRREGHAAGTAPVSPPHRRGADVTIARFRTDYDAVAALDRFSGWLRDGAAADGEPGRARGGSGDRPVEPPTVSLATTPDADEQDSPEGAGPGPDGPDQPPGARLAGRWGIRPASPGALSTGATANGSPANGSPANGSPANGSPANGSPANGSPANGSPANGSPANGSPANGPTVNGSTPNGPTANGTNGNSPRANDGPVSPEGTGVAAPPGSYGDPVSALYEQHYSSLVRLAALLVRDTATAEEIVQDSFVAAATAWRRRAGTDGALDFLRQSVLNRSRSALRHGITPAPADAGLPVRLPAAAGRARRAARPAARGARPALLREPVRGAGRGRHRHQPRSGPAARHPGQCRSPHPARRRLRRATRAQGVFVACLEAAGAPACGPGLTAAHGPQRGIGDHTEGQVRPGVAEPRGSVPLPRVG